MESTVPTVRGAVSLPESCGGRHRRVVDVARDDDGLDAVFFTEGQNLFKNEPLILQHIKPVDPFAQVQVCKVQKFHGVSPDFAFTATASPRS